MEMAIKKAQKIGINILNLLMQTVHSEKVHVTTGTYQKSIDMSNNDKGIYFLQLLSEDGIVNRKIVIE